jgi:hypothetical protein
MFAGPSPNAGPSGRNPSTGMLVYSPRRTTHSLLEEELSIPAKAGSEGESMRHANQARAWRL